MMTKALRPIKRRMRLLRAAKGFCIGLVGGCAVALALAIAAFLMPIERLFVYIAVVVAGCPILCTLIAALLPVTTKSAAARADSLGLKERVRTALAFSDNDEPIYHLQREDAKARLAALPVKKVLPIRFEKRLLLISLAAAVACGGLFLIPNPQNDVLRARETERTALRAEADMLEKDAEAMMEGLTPEEQKELRRITADMARELREAQDKREALAALSEKQKEMDRLKENIGDRLARETAEALSGQSSLSSLADAMASGGESETSAALSEIEKMMNDAKTAQELAEQLEAAAQEAPAGAIRQGLSTSASQCASGNAANAMASLNAALASAGSTGANVSALVQSARAGVASAGQGGSGLGQGQGQGQGQGSGGGGGAGRGSTNRDAGMSNSMSQSAQGDGTGPTIDKLGQYERIYDPTRLGDGGEISMVEGVKGEGESQQMQLSPNMGDFSGQVPYGQVIGNYQEAAAQSMRRAALPEAMQDVISRYFNALIE